MNIQPRVLDEKNDAVLYRDDGPDTEQRSSISRLDLAYLNLFCEVTGVSTEEIAPKLAADTRVQLLMNRAQHPVNH